MNVKTPIGFLVAGLLTVHSAVGQFRSDDEAQREAAIMSAIKTGMRSGNCVPPRKIIPSNSPGGDPLGYELALTAAVDNLLMCAILETYRHPLKRELVACWKLDSRARLLAVEPALLVPGYSVNGDACRQFGLCRPDPSPPGEQDHDVIAASFDGKRIAVIGSGSSGSVALFDASKRTFVRAFSYRESIGNYLIQAFYLGESVFLLGADAGPFAQVMRFGADGAALGPIHQERNGLFNISGGEVRVRDGTRLVARDQGFVEVVFDVINNKATVARLPRPSACTPAQFKAFAESEEDESQISPFTINEIGGRCLSAVKEARRRFWKPIGFVHQGLSYEILEGSRKRELVIRNPTSGKIEHTRALPICTVNARRPRAR